MLLTGDGLIVSLPARELAGFRPSGSLFEAEELREASLSEELLSALQAVTQFCAARNVSLRFLARPEIFTHGDSLEWLRRRLGGVTDHLCVSDGYAVRPLPSMRNHLFLYRLGSHEHAIAFRRLERCAPELLGSMTTQVNTALAFGRGIRSISPPPVLLQVLRRRRSSATASWQLYAPDREVAASVSPHDVFRNVRDVTYVPLTTSACHDRAFGKMVGGVVSACVADESRGCVIRVPELAARAGTPNAAFDALMRSLRRVAVRGGKHRPAVVLTGADLIEQRPATLTCPMTLVLHPSYEFWRHPRERYACFSDIQVFSTTHDIGLSKLLSLAVDREPQLPLAS